LVALLSFVMGSDSRCRVPVRLGVLPSPRTGVTLRPTRSGDRCPAGIAMDATKTQLLFGPYRPPPLRVGDRALCRYRDTEVVVCDGVPGGVVAGLAGLGLGPRVAAAVGLPGRRRQPAGAGELAEGVGADAEAAGELGRADRRGGVIHGGGRPGELVRAGVEGSSQYYANRGVKDKVAGDSGDGRGPVPLDRPPRPVNGVVRQQGVTGPLHECRRTVAILPPFSRGLHKWRDAHAEVASRGLRHARIRRSWAAGG
jgi:hypothetical protein